MASALPFGPATLTKGGESAAKPDLAPDVQRGSCLTLPSLLQDNGFTVNFRETGHDREGL